MLSMTPQNQIIAHPSWFMKKNVTKNKQNSVIKIASNVSQYNEQAVPIKEPVSVKFKNDYDITRLDLMVKTKLRNEIVTINSLKTAIYGLKSNLKSATTIISHNNTIQKITDLENEVYEIENGIKALKYINDSKHILELYRSIPKPVKYIDIGEEHVDEDEIFYDNNDDMRVTCIMEYLDIASDYIQLDIIREKEKQVTNKCKNCGYDLREVDVGIDGQQVCPCGFGRYKTKMDKIVECGDKTTSTTKDYSDENNFRKALLRFIGVQKITFDIPTICDALDKYFMSVGHKSASHYKSLPDNNWGKKDGTSLDLLLNGFKAIKCSKLYEDANIVGMHLWGWVLPDLSGMIDTIMNDYRETQKVYENMALTARGRKSCLSTQLRLYAHLLMRGVNVRKEDFKIPKQRDSLVKQDELWKYMCDGTDNPNIYYISLL